MRNIFKTFKENKNLLQENELLKAQNKALMEFRKNFDNYYHAISGAKVMTRSYDNKAILSGTVSLDREGLYWPTDVCKEDIAHKISRQLLPFIEYDVIDNEAYGTKSIVGRLIVLTK